MTTVPWNTYLSSHGEETERAVDLGPEEWELTIPPAHPDDKPLSTSYPESSEETRRKYIKSVKIRAYNFLIDAATSRIKELPLHYEEFIASAPEAKETYKEHFQRDIKLWTAKITEYATAILKC